MKTFSIIMLSAFLILGISINYEIDREFLELSNFSRFMVIASLIFFIGIKTMSEIYLFSVKGLKKLIVGPFTISLILVSIYAGSVTREHISEKGSQAQKRLAIQSEIDALSKYIESVQEKLSGTHFSYIGIIKQYREEIKSLIAKKATLIRSIPKESFNEEFHLGYVYIASAIMIELGLLFLSHIIVVQTRKPEEKKEATVQAQPIKNIKYPQGLKSIIDYIPIDKKELADLAEVSVRTVERGMAGENLSDDTKEKLNSVLIRYGVRY